MLTRRNLLLSAALLVPGAARTDAANASPPLRLVAAARAQIGVTTIYDPAYEAISYPMGDVARSRGVCTDVVIRAYRDGLGIDLQQLVHEDMGKNFSGYPKIWGLKRTDSNIDHRRVPNLQRFFSRRGAARADPDSSTVFATGDLVTMMLPGHLPHIAIVSDRRSGDEKRPLVIHNIGAGTQEEDSLVQFPLTGHYRYALE